MTNADKENIKARLIRWGELDCCISDMREECEKLKKLQTANEHAERISRFEAEIERMNNERWSVYDILQALNKRERDIIYCRYNDGMCWDYISEKVGLSRMHCFRMHDRALKSIYEFLEDNKKV